MPRPLAIWLDLPWRDRWRWLFRKCRDALPGMQHIASADRKLLEGRWLAGYAADPALRTLLFVGCEWYTHDYAELFAPRRERFRTIDVDATKARHGSADHIVAPLQDAQRHLAPESVDVIVCNGVYGFGIDDRAELLKALRSSHAVLRPGGALLLGWNDVATLAPFDPSGPALEAGFVRDAARGDGWRERTDTPTRHTFDFYRKPLRVAAADDAAARLAATP